LFADVAHLTFWIQQVDDGSDEFRHRNETLIGDLLQ
jgi:hypothetical protein